MMNHTRRVLEWGFGLGLALTVVLTVLTGWQRTAARVRADTLRLHVLANSDTWAAQRLHFPGGAAGLAALPPAGCAASSPEEAAAALRQALPALQAAANAALHRAHSAQTARLRLEQAEFAARDYGSFALPGGRYTALRVELGAAAGRNWFCVLYPALCVAGAQADYPTAGEKAKVFGRGKERLAAVDFVRGLAARIQ